MNAANRFANILGAFLMILCSIILQSLLFLIAAGMLFGFLSAMGYELDFNIVFWGTIGFLFLIFNSVAFFEYFRRTRANVTLGKTASLFFYVPRAIDVIVTGKQRVQR